jgi:hypothetical protein
MNNQVLDQKSRKYRVSDIDWDELDQIGIHKNELEQNGDLEKLLSGEPVTVISLHLTILGLDLNLDATIQIIEEDNQLKLDICSITPEQMN